MGLPPDTCGEINETKKEEDKIYFKGLKMGFESGFLVGVLATLFFYIIMRFLS